MLNGKIVTVFGGTGFIGRYAIQNLAKLGYTVRVPTRYTADANALRPKGVVGQINPLSCNLRNPQSIAHAVRGSSIVINLIGVLTESRKSSFDFIHSEVPGRIARAAAEAGADRMIHISAIGANPDAVSKYAASKGHGEAQLREAFPQATILRPSIVFGPEDQFFNRFAAMARIAHALPLIGGGKTKFQPVYVGDVAAAIVNALTDGSTAGKTYELGGPEVLSFRQLMQLMLKVIDRSAILLPVPFGIAKLQARFTELVPGKPLTRDQVELLKRDNVVAKGAEGLAELGVTPTALELVLPQYLDRFAKGGRFHEGPHAEKFYS
jgi:NADH dehydrogenase